jgi:hypothetical protein
VAHRIAKAGESLSPNKPTAILIGGISPPTIMLPAPRRGAKRFITRFTHFSGGLLRSRCDAWFKQRTPVDATSGINMDVSVSVDTIETAIAGVEINPASKSYQSYQLKSNGLPRSWVSKVRTSDE